MQIVPIQSVPSQTLSVSLSGQTCRINVYQKSTGVFLDLYVNDVLIIGGVICENKNRIVRSLYLGFIGDLAFFDTQGTDDPDYTGLGTRWLFLYLLPADIIAPSFDAAAFTPLPPYIPVVPTLFATPGIGGINWAWSHIPGATSYNLYLSTTPGVTPATGTKYPQLGTTYAQGGISGSAKVTTKVVSGHAKVATFSVGGHAYWSVFRKAYYGVVTAVVSGVEGLPSNEASASV